MAVLPRTVHHLNCSRLSRIWIALTLPGRFGSRTRKWLLAGWFARWIGEKVQLPEHGPIDEALTWSWRYAGSTTLEEIRKDCGRVTDFLYGSFPGWFRSRCYWKRNTEDWVRWIRVRPWLSGPAATGTFWTSQPRSWCLGDWAAEWFWADELHGVGVAASHCIPWHLLLCTEARIDYVLARTAGEDGHWIRTWTRDLSHIFTRSNEHRYCKVVRTGATAPEPMIPEEEVDEYVSGESEIPAGHDVMHEPETEIQSEKISTPGNLAQTPNLPGTEGRPISQPHTWTNQQAPSAARAHSSGA